MIMAFLSSRIRTWVLFAVLLPLFGRLLEKLGVRVADRNPRAGRALATTSSMMRRRGKRGAAPVPPPPPPR